MLMVLRSPAQVLIGYSGRAVDLAEDFTVAASNVITTLTFEKEVSTESALKQTSV